MKFLLQLNFLTWILLVQSVVLYEQEDPWNVWINSLFEDQTEKSETIKLFDSYKHLTDIEDYPNVCSDYSKESCARKWIDTIEPIIKRNRNRMGNVDFQYSTDINKANKLLKKKFIKEIIPINFKLQIKARKFQWKAFKDVQLKRIFKLITPTIMSSNMSVALSISKIDQAINQIYNKARPVVNGKKLSAGESEIVNFFATSRNYDQLKEAWVSWRKLTGRKIRNFYFERVKLLNIGAREHGYNDAKHFRLLQDFEQKNYDQTIMKLFNEIFPFYRELHGFIRYCLAEFYSGKFNRDGPIPAHILGNLWGQQWNNIQSIVDNCMHKKSSKNKNLNFQNEASLNLQKYSINKMFRTSESFFQSIGLFGMTEEFWQRSVLSKQKDKLIDCHGSASDFSNGRDYRIKMCTEKTLEDFAVIHHEMGHVEYYMSYSNLSIFFHNSANSGFHEAVGDTIALSVKTPQHLKSIGLISSVPDSSDFDINYLMSIALEKVVFLPYAVTMESFTWAVFNGSVKPAEANAYWWKLRRQFQGFMPPVDRSELDFDPAAKYHIAMDIDYSRYFVSFLVQFQFYEKLCHLSHFQGKYLHNCDFYLSTNSGKQFLSMLAKGTSLPWPETLESFTGTDKIETGPILRYFKPLHDWLININRKLNIKVGW